MAPISKIADTTAVRVIQGQQGSPNGPPADTVQELDSPGHSTGLANPEKTVASSENSKSPATKQVTLDQAKQLADQLQEILDQAASERYSVAFRQINDSSEFIIEITDDEGKLIKQFPQEKVLNLQRSLDELSGMVIDEMM